MQTSRLHVALYQPEIPQNTGNIIRLCANAGASLHLIEPLGFAWDDRRLKRAGLDYHQLARVTRYPDWQVFTQTLLPRSGSQRLLAWSTRGTQCHAEVSFCEEDILLFGPETRGLPESVMTQSHGTLRLPMTADARSMNLSNAVAVGVYEAWRQLGFQLHETD